MWRQGLDDAPPIVQMCYESWRRLNPDWDIEVLSADNLAQYAQLPEWADTKLSNTQYSDLARLLILQKHGGVWADATTLCNWPLDSWLPQMYPTGFFAFARPARGYVLSSWFLAAEPDHPLVVMTKDRLADYWQRAGLEQPGTSRAILGKILVRLLRLTPRTTELWMTKPIRDWLRVYPYFAIHYAFANAVRTDQRAREAWQGTPKLSSDGPHALQAYGLARRPDPAMRLEIAQPTTPLYKLNYRKIDAFNDPASVLGELRRNVESASLPPTGR
jgi:hypothetical protein